MMFILPSTAKTFTPTVFLAWFALCTTAKPVWFPAVLPKSNANFEVELPFPFEVVLRTWENGPPDPQFLREEVKETRSGYEIEKSKTIYTKNPFPYLIQKTVIRDKELIFIEVQRLNMKQKIAQYWSVNKCMEYVGKAFRTSTIRAHPTKPGHTLIEQAGGVEVNTNVPGALRGPIENFACGAFIDVCKQALNKLNVTLQRSKHTAVPEEAPESSTIDDASQVTSSGTLQGLGLVLGGLCCKMLLGGSWRGSSSTVKEQDATKARDAAAADARAALASKPIFTRHTPPFRAAAAAFAVALVSTQLF